MDCNNFFVSCERLFRPDLRHKPTAVLSSNDGCIVARSQEVKDLGISMGVPFFQVKDICKKEGITLFSSNFPLYRDISSRVMCALKEEFENCEVYSVDESFFQVEEDVSDDEILEIRARIMQKTGIPVSFGIGKTKTIAKSASTFAKKGTGVRIFDMNGWNAVIHEVSCGSIWGIGRQTTDKLRKTGINTVGDFLLKGIAYYRNDYGVVGERMYQELVGTPMYGVGDTDYSIPKSMTSTRSFKGVVKNRSVLESAIGYHATHLAEKLRAEGITATSLTVIASPSRFGDYALRKNSATRILEYPTSDTTVLLKESLKLLDMFYDAEIPYKKAGILLGGIIPDGYVSKTIFSDTDTKSDSIYEVTDHLNERFGSGTIHPGVVFETSRWKDRAALRSKEYTTDWNEIRSIKAI